MLLKWIWKFKVEPSIKELKVYPKSFVIIEVSIVVINGWSSYYILDFLHSSQEDQIK